MELVRTQMEYVINFEKEPYIGRWIFLGFFVLVSIGVYIWHKLND